MSDTERAYLVQPARPGAHRRRILAAILGLSVLSAGAGAMSLAIFTDTAASTGTFAAGTVDITSSPTVAFTVTGMMPGDTNTQAMTIANAGTATFRYAMSTTATNNLGTALTLTVRTLGTSCATFDGTIVVATTALNGAAIGSDPGRPGRRPHAGRTGQRGPVLPGQPAAGHR